MSLSTISIHRKRREVVRILEQICQKVRQDVLAFAGKVEDTVFEHGHESSTIDSYARFKMFEAIEDLLPEMSGSIRFELRPFIRSPLEKLATEDALLGSLIIDEIDGTTNTKRCIASPLPYLPQAAISIAWSTTEFVADIQASCVTTLSGNHAFSAVKSENTFISFVDCKRIDPEDIVDVRGDSKPRVLVIGYSNSHRLKKGELEQAIYDSNIKTYEGCRSSTIDIINVIRGGYDAYVDMRALWSTKDNEGHEKEAQLQIYDAAGVLPVAEGCGLVISDHLGKPWTTYKTDGALPLIVSRPSVYDKLLKVIKPLTKKWNTALSD